MRTFICSHHHLKTPSCISILFIFSWHDVILFSSPQCSQTPNPLRADIRWETLRSLCFLFPIDVIYFLAFYIKWNADPTQADITHLSAINQCWRTNTPFCLHHQHGALAIKFCEGYLHHQLGHAVASSDYSLHSSVTLS